MKRRSARTASGRRPAAPPPPRALAAAAEWRLMGLLLERPRPEWRAEIEALAREVRHRALRRAAAAAQAGDEGEYLRLVGPGGPVSPRAVAYRFREDPGWVLADVARFYEAFAFHPRAEDPIDHIAVETGFAAYLFMKEAFARASGDSDAARTTAAARRHFLTRHLAPLAAHFSRRLEAVGGSYLVAPARLLAARVPASGAQEPAAEPADGGADCGSCPLG